ncbi:hypothetical protein N7510_009783 [Penicillium lagena]|uniref:uncharacterized protein n=1 Tax=Penicillium lagena TaxID=94218 RepID=UPI002540716D|nr:uncharacterized protein N7510_009783 [Penicillium lagena]KAJ5604629.1 hypothetical protein N7510_009783 [Penicillium lagena]
MPAARMIYPRTNTRSTNSPLSQLTYCLRPDTAQPTRAGNPVTATVRPTLDRTGSSATPPHGHSSALRTLQHG